MRRKHCGAVYMRTDIISTMINWFDCTSSSGFWFSFFFFRDWDQVVTHEQIEWGEESNAINKEQRICHLWEIECGAKWKSATEKIPGDVTLNGKLFPFRLLYMWRQRQGCAPYSQQIYSVIRSLQTPFYLHDNTNNTHTEAHRRTN